MRARCLPLFALLAGTFARGPLWAANKEQAASCPRAQGSVERQTDGGWLQSYPQPLAAAIRLELAAQAAFQKRQYDESRRQFEAALAADPSYLLPQIGLACIAVRKDQFDIAAQEIALLLRKAYVPWHRVALGDIDLAALWAHAEKTVLAGAVKEAAENWGKRVESGVLLLSRVAAPVQLAAEDGPLVFRPAQEIVSWDPFTGRFHQVTSEAGRVVAFVRSDDGKSVLYLTAQKVRRESGMLSSFQSVGVHLLRLADMRLVSKPLSGFDTRYTKIALRFHTGQAQVAAKSSTQEEMAFAFDDELRPLQRTVFPLKKGLLVSPREVGEDPVRDFVTEKSCRFRLKPAFVKGIPTVLVVPAKGSSFYLASRFGLGLNRLPMVEGPRKK